MRTPQQLRLVRVEWTGPLTYQEVTELNSQENDFGIYQICAYHNVFGPQSLIYVGKAQQRPFAIRFSEHWQDWLKNQREIKIYVGRMFREDFNKDDNHADWNQLLADLECLTIHYHSPPFNSMSIGQYSGQPLHVQFWGDRGALMQEFSSHWVEARPDDSEPE